MSASVMNWLEPPFFWGFPAVKNKSPAFQFYPNEWLGSTNITLMSPAEEGAYIRLLCIAWNDPDCSITSDDKELSILSRLGEGWFKDGSRVVLKCFNQHPTKPGRLVNNRLLEEREKQRKWREKSSEGGKKSAESRRKDISKGGARVVQPKVNSSSSSSIASSIKNPAPIGKHSSTTSYRCTENQMPVSEEEF